MTAGDPELITTRWCEGHLDTFVADRGEVLAVFDHRTQDSGNVSWLVDTGRGRFFVKSAGRPGPPPHGAPAPYLDHPSRVALLRNAIELARSVDHECLPPLRAVIESIDGPGLVYDAVPDELVGVPRSRRADPASAYRRFATLPAMRLLGALDRLIDLHDQLARSGWVGCDLYDGSLIHDEASDRLSVIDLDSYHRGPFTNTMGRMFGSDRFMAPEEYELGARIDERTTVFTLGRIARHFGTRLTERPEEFVGGPVAAAVVERACRPDRRDRHPDVAAFAQAWRDARGHG